MPRNDKGIPLSLMHEVKETALADSLRAAVISSMVENGNELLASLGPNCNEILNADVPQNIHFASLDGRLWHMSNPTSSVGELEIVATAKYLNKTIIVVNDAFENINVYNDVYERNVDDCIVIAYHKIGYAIRHYNAVLRTEGEETDDSTAALVNPATDNILTMKETAPYESAGKRQSETAAKDIPLPRKSTISKRRRRCQQSESITSSPYKKKLMESETIKKKEAPKRRPALGLQQNRNKTRPKTQGKKTSATAKPAEEESWFCFICCEDLKEAMTRCISCSHWVHNKCADETKLVGLHYVCDLCT